MIQIIGTAKCKATGKAVRFFRERRIQFQFVDLSERGLSAGELKNISRFISPENLVDREGREYAEKNLAYIRHDIGEQLLLHPLLLKTPVVRTKTTAVCGEAMEEWKKIAESAKG